MYLGRCGIGCCQIFIFFWRSRRRPLFENCWDCCYFSADVLNQDCDLFCFLLLRTAVVVVVVVVVFAPSARESCLTV